MANLNKPLKPAQLGFVVKDLKQAARHYSSVYGVKKWYRVVNEPMGELFYKGKPFTDSGYDMVVGYCGGTEIELITTAAEENIYTKHLDAYGEGLHHVSFFVKSIEPYIEKYRALGFEVVQNGTINGKTMKSSFAYMQRKEGEDIIEVCEVKAGKLSLTRNSFNIGFGVITGDLERFEL